MTLNQFYTENFAAINVSFNPAFERVLPRSGRALRLCTLGVSFISVLRFVTYPCIA